MKYASVVPTQTVHVLLQALLGGRQLILGIVRVPRNDQGLLSHVILSSFSFPFPFFLCLYSSFVSHFTLSLFFLCKHAPVSLSHAIIITKCLATFPLCNTTLSLPKFSPLVIKLVLNHFFWPCLLLTVMAFAPALGRYRDSCVLFMLRLAARSALGIGHIAV